MKTFCISKIYSQQPTANSQQPTANPLALLLLIAVLFFMGKTADCQPVNNVVKEVVPPAPNAAALDKFGEIPVSYFTGVPNFSIPIHTVQEGPLSVPVSLSYHSSGAKVAEMASWVGLGWNLNAGGMVTRTIQGTADDVTYGYFNYYSSIPDPGETPAEATYYQSVANGTYDTEPDIFSYNFLGYSGKFFIDHNHVVQTIPKQDVVITIEGSNPFEGFTIITPDGNRHIFGKFTSSTGAVTTAREYSRSNNEAAGGRATSWYLLRIETHDKKFAIDFSYTSEAYSYQSPAYCKQIDLLTSCIPPNQQSVGDLLTCSSEIGDDYNHRHITTNMDGKHLLKISSSTSTVEFLANTDREDLDVSDVYGNNKKSLDVVKVYSLDNAGAVNTNFCFQYKFTYSYMVTGGGTSGKYKRLFLNQVQKTSCEATNPSISEPAYQFAYEAGTMPHRLSKQVDHWGYYNGQTANENKLINIPPTTITVPFLGNNYTFDYGESNRNSSEDHMKIGVLKQITYPTGGSTSFTYEANKANVTEPGYPEYINGTFWLMTCFNPADPNCCCGGTTPPGCVNSQRVVSKYHTFAAGTNLNAVKFHVQLTRLVSTNTCNGQVPTDVAVSMTVFDGSSSKGQLTYNLAAAENTHLSTNDILAYFNLQTGINYRFELASRDGFASFDMFTVPSVNYDKVVGGLRIKEMLTKDAVSDNNDIVKKYEYTENDPLLGNISSGRIFFVERYAYAFPYGVCFTESGTTPMGGFSAVGYHIGYRQVKEIAAGNSLQTQANGYTIYTYEANVEVPINATQNYPIVPPQYYDHQGKSNSIQQYKLGGGTAVSTTDNTYEATANTTYTTGNMFKMSPTMINCAEIYAIASPPLFFRISNERRPVTVIKSLDGVSSTTTYEYDGSNRFLAPTAVTMTNSDGKTTKTTNKYIFDFNNNAVRTELLARNLIAAPFETLTSVGADLLSGSSTYYAGFNADGTFFSETSMPTSGGHPRPRAVSNYERTYVNGTIEPSGAWAIQGIFNAYNDKGLPTSFTTQNWPYPETYTWSANGLLLTNSYNGYTKTYDYFPNTRLMRSMKEIDGRASSYTYDKFWRLSTALRDGTGFDATNMVVTGPKVRSFYVYHYKYTPSDKNWVKDSTAFTAKTGSSLSFIVNNQFLDGLGRPLETVKKRWSPNKNASGFAYDVVVGAVEYDHQGRVVKKYTPFQSTKVNGAFFAIPSGQKYTLLTYDSSQLSRPRSATPPDWYTAQTWYGANSGNEVDYYGGVLGAYYPSGSLFKTVSIQPKEATAKILNITYKDKKGRLVLSRTRQQGTTVNADTYYLYDDKDRLTTVLPPGVGTTTADANLRFEYQYSGDNLMLSKKVPDAAIVKMKYNNRDQMRLMQDGNQLAAGRWFLTNYDDFGHPVSTGLTTGDANISPNGNIDFDANLQFTATTYGTAADITLGKIINAKTYIPGNIATEYLNQDFTYNAVTGRNAKISANNQLYYTAGSDVYDYDYDNAGNLLSETRTMTGEPVYKKSMTYDHAGRMEKLFQTIGTAEQQLALNKYDHRDRLIEKNLGSTLATCPSCESALPSWLQSIDYTYNEQNWLTALNGGTTFAAATPLSVCTADAVNPNPLEPTVTATYNPDENDLFKFGLKYDDVASNPLVPFNTTTNKPQLNGNISQVLWQVRGRNVQGYNLKYDQLNRLTSAYYADFDGTGLASSDLKYQENVTYNDLRGNISAINRKGLYKLGTNTCYSVGNIDVLALTTATGYNRLQSVTDATANATAKAQGFNPGAAATGATYAYDDNGNMKTDPYKNMTVTYNHLNLPIKFAMPNTKSIEILYDQSGKKLRKTVKDGTTVKYVQDYVGNLEFRTVGTARRLEAIYHDEGRIAPRTYNAAGTPTAYRYEYSIRDHLGNTRLTFADTTGDGMIQVPEEIIQENHYYPFGMSMNYAWMNNTAPDTKYQYNGKEMNDDWGLGLMDYGARWYDGAIGRWWSCDPKSESFLRFTPYNGFLSNPINIVDIKGDSSWPVTREWSGQDVNGYSEFVDNEISNMKSNKESFDCADLATTLLVRYASSNGLEVSFTNVEGESVSSSSDQASSPKEFEQTVKATTNAESIKADMETIMGAPRPGDVTNNGFHVNVVTSPDPNTSYDTNGAIPTTSGSLPDRVPKDSYVSPSSVFSRWNVLMDAARSAYEDR